MKIEDARMFAANQSGGISSSVIYDAVLDAAAAAQPAPNSILDFGSGSGQLLPLLRQRFPGASLNAADIMAAAANLLPGVKWTQADLNADVPIAAASFDLIVAAEVIEHLENPRALLREFARMLRPGGVAIVSTPNTRSLRSLITFAMRGHHAQFDDSNYPAHITPMAEIDFLRCGNEAGLTLDRFFYTDRGTIPKLLNHYWQDLPLVGSRFRGRAYSDNFGAIYRKSASD